MNQSFISKTDIPWLCSPHTVFSTSRSELYLECPGKLANAQSKCGFRVFAIHKKTVKYYKN